MTKERTKRDFSHLFRDIPPRQPFWTTSGIGFEMTDRNKKSSRVQKGSFPQKKHTGCLKTFPLRFIVL